MAWIGGSWQGDEEWAWESGGSEAQVAANTGIGVPEARGWRCDVDGWALDFTRFNDSSGGTRGQLAEVPVLGQLADGRRLRVGAHF